MSYEIDSTPVVESSQYDAVWDSNTEDLIERDNIPITSADIYGKKSDINNYVEYTYPEAAQLIDIHGVDMKMLSWDSDSKEYIQIVEGITNKILQENKFVENSMNPYYRNEEYHFVRDSAMFRICGQLGLRDFPAPVHPKNADDDEIAGFLEKSRELANFVLYAHLPEVERMEKIANDSDATRKSVRFFDTDERASLIAEARRKLAEDGAMPIIMDAMEGRAYTGEIVEIGSAYAVQKIDEGRGIIHNLQYLKDFTRVLNESNVPFIEISYDRDMNGSMDVKKDACHGKTVAMTR